jgi:hypothetical protein
LLPAGSDLGAVQLSNSSGDPSQLFTHLTLQNQTLVSLDGAWTREQLSLGLA